VVGIATVTYFSQDLKTGQILADLPLSGVRFSRVLNGHGALNGSMPLAGLSAQRRRDLIDAVDPVRRALYAEVDGNLIWGGPIWVDADDRPEQVQAQEWGSYFASACLLQDRSYLATDQLTIARDLVATAQAGPGGGTIRVALGAETSGVPRDQDYLASDLPVIGELLADLGNLDDGFDWSWPVEYDAGGLPRGRLLLGYPRLGSAEPSIAVEPGSTAARNLGYSRDGTQLAVISFATGQAPTSGAEVPVKSSTDATLLDAGYLPLHKVKNYQNETDDLVLQAHADADQKASGGTLATVKATVSMEAVLRNGVSPGDLAQISSDSPRFPDGYEATLRISQLDYDPGARTVDLTLAPRIEIGGKVPG
jgi:hypothetical protein